VIRRRFAGAASAVVVALLLAGCAGSATRLDRSATERSVGEAVANRTGLPIARTTCPTDIPRQTGRVTACRVAFDGARGLLHVSVRQRDRQGHLEVTFVEAVTDRATIATDLRRTLVARYHRSFLVDCGPAGPLVVAVGHRFACRARDHAGPRQVVASVVDAGGTLRYAVG